MTITEVAKFGILLSVTFVQELPSFSVSQTPPPTVPTNHLLLFVGSTTIPLVLPGTLFGPLSVNTAFGEILEFRLPFALNCAFLNSFKT